MYSHNQKDPDLIYNTNMSIETILTKKLALSIPKCGLPLFCV